ncbi:hypothetical protein KPL70_015794 [Citrus sinensis]|uniref:PWWP domain-containing protein n=1 Tax=Citrus clementina TaxID=85681 RepID=V4T6J6_CITCL|nr:putative oxidoreductase GLYR1 isoform X2 [Citrus x clementina]XP_052296372.1 PWWP domain-containing protein 5-like isoform X4 [Citrus sinensis]ESR47075.1 hypothetical protein CICLE_v10002397mg [Citrus x clementina]KAH9690403.1 hypothetical protein KPL70_015794 [Citrus sinensis]
MRSNRVSGGRNCDSDRDGEKFVVKQLEGQFFPGDVTWAKLRGNKWWPAVVVDENTVSECNKPSKRASGGFLVRLYGSYEYLYVDPIKFHLEFQKVLEQSNGSHREIFEKALEQDLSHMKSGCSKEGKYKSDSASVQEQLKRKYSKQGSGHKKLKPNNTSDEKRRMSEISMEEQDEKPMLNSPNSEASLLGTSHELSARRLRVMQSLGLVAPSGSPFS